MNNTNNAHSTAHKKRWLTATLGIGIPLVVLGLVVLAIFNSQDSDEFTGNVGEAILTPQEGQEFVVLPGEEDGQEIDGGTDGLTTRPTEDPAGEGVIQIGEVADGLTTEEPDDGVQEVVFVGDIDEVTTEEPVVDPGDGGVVQIGGELTTEEPDDDVQEAVFVGGIGEVTTEVPGGVVEESPNELTFGNTKLNTWLAASNVQLSSGTVVGMTDLSGNGNNVQTTPGAGPVLVNNDPEFNYQPYLNFDGANDFLESVPSAPGANSERVFVVMRARNTTNTDPVLQFDTPQSNATEFSGLLTEPGIISWLANQNTVSSTSDFDGTANQRPFVAEMWQGKMWINGVPVSWDPNGYFNDPFFQEPPLFENLPFLLGTDAGQKAFADVDVAEVLMFDQNLTLQELTNLRSYLFTKYSISAREYAVLGHGYMLNNPGEYALDYAFVGSTIIAENNGYRSFGLVNLPDLLDMTRSRSVQQQGILGLRAQNLEPYESVFISSNNNLDVDLNFINNDLGEDGIFGTDDDDLLNNLDPGEDGVLGTDDDGVIGGGGGGGGSETAWGVVYGDADGQTNDGAEYTNRFWRIQTNASDGSVGDIVITLEVDTSLPNQNIYAPQVQGGDFAVPHPAAGEHYYLIFSDDTNFNDGLHLELRDDGLGGDLTVGNNVYSVTLENPEDFNYFTLGRSSEDLGPGGELDTPPSIVTMDSAVQRPENPKLVDIDLTISDPNNEDDLQLLVEYETDNDGACNGPWDSAFMAAPVSASYGNPELLNVLQQGFQDGYQINDIETSAAFGNENTVSLVWFIALNQPGISADTPQCLQFSIREESPLQQGETESFPFSLDQDVPPLLCGNTSIDAGEQCDDGNFVNGDGCSSMCQDEGGAGAVCGDGSIDGPEQCDDDNTNNGDGCSSVCQVEPGYECIGEPSVCTEICGDSLVVGTETCDDGNTNNGDGCSSICQNEDGVISPPFCGNNILDAGEQCDDGNSVTEACAYGQESCQVCGASCQWVPGSSTSYCGDGDIDAGEQCDDGNDVTEACAYGQQNCTVCSNTCQNTSGSSTSYCGDGVEDEFNGEQCDDGNTASGDGCSAICQAEGGSSNDNTITPPQILDPDTGDQIDDDDSLVVSAICEPGQTIQIWVEQNGQLVNALVTNPLSLECPSAGKFTVSVPWDNDADFGDYDVVVAQYNDNGTKTGEDSVEIEFGDFDTGAIEYDPVNFDLTGRCLKYNPERDLDILDMNVSDPYYDEIQLFKGLYYLGDDGVTTQYPFGGYGSTGISNLTRVNAGGDNVLSRLEAVKFIGSLHCMAVLDAHTIPKGVLYDGSPAPVIYDEQVDYNKSDWRQDIWKTYFFLGIFEGTDEGNLELDRPVRTDEFVKMMMNALKYRENGQNLPRNDSAVPSSISPGQFPFPFLYYSQAAAENAILQRMLQPYNVAREITRKEAFAAALNAVVRTRDLLDPQDENTLKALLNQIQN